MLISVSVTLLALSQSVMLAADNTAPAEAPIPRLASENGQYRFLVDGEPFLMLGGQAHNSTTSNAEELQRYFEALVWMNANTAEVPIYWELIEPEPGTYDFTIVDRTIEMARTAGVRLIFLWFASWKNGESHYAPVWVKRDLKTYPRVIDAWGKRTDILSPLSEASRDADARAFRAVMNHIREVDEAHRTVIMMQVENEPGFLHTDRDYSQTAEELFKGEVPGELLGYLREHRDGLSETMASY
ncbi:MAG: beta-galactosidase [Candidatus Hydrogenedentota bacterium]